MKNMNKRAMTMFMTILTVFALSFAFVSPDLAAAETAWDKAGITADDDFENSSIYDDLDMIVYFVMALGGFWILACLIFAGVKLASAQGGNPQGRTQGFVGLAMAFVGGWVIMKAYTIAGWIAGFGA